MWFQQYNLVKENTTAASHVDVFMHENAWVVVVNITTTTTKKSFIKEGKGIIKFRFALNLVKYYMNACMKAIMLYSKQ